MPQPFDRNQFDSMPLIHNSKKQVLDKQSATEALVEFINKGLQLKDYSTIKLQLKQIVIDTENQISIAAIAYNHPQAIEMEVGFLDIINNTPDNDINCFFEQTATPNHQNEVITFTTILAAKSMQILNNFYQDIIKEW
jgi:hypothetical protein